MATVAKPFNTVNRRFRPGAEVAATDDLSPHSFGDLAERGFIAAQSGEKPEPEKPEAARSRLRK